MSFSPRALAMSPAASVRVSRFQTVAARFEGWAGAETLVRIEFAAGPTVSCWLTIPMATLDTCPDVDAVRAMVERDVAMVLRLRHGTGDS